MPRPHRARRRAAAAPSISRPTCSATETQRQLLYEAVQRRDARAPPGHLADQDARPGRRRRSQAVAPEGHRPGARGHDPLAALEGRRHRVRAAAPRLRRQDQPQGDAARRARGALASTPRREPRRVRRRLVRGAAHEGRARPRGGLRPSSCRSSSLVAARTIAARCRSATSSASIVAWRRGASTVVELAVGAQPARLAGRARRAPGRCRVTSVTTDPRHVILAPVVSEKAYSLIQFDKYTFKVHPKAHKTQVRQAIELLFGVQVVAVKIVNVPGKPKRRGPDLRLPARLQEGDRRSCATANRSSSSRGRADGRPSVQAHVAGPSLHDDLGFRRDHDRQAREEPARAGQAQRRPQQHRPHHDAPPGRRPQAPLPHHRLQAAQGRRSGKRRVDRVRPQPLGAHRAAALRGRRTRPTSWRPRGSASGRRCSPATTPTSRSATACRCRRSRPARSCTPWSCGPVRARAWCARPARALSSSPKEGATRSCACPRASSAACPRPAARRSASVSNATHQNAVERQGRPLALAGQAPDGARHGDEPGRPPARRRRGQEQGRSPGHAVGQDHARAPDT